jgi:hypothetical protein
MTPRLQHLVDLVSALERRLDAPREDADEWLFTADLYGRVAAFDVAERAEAGVAERWHTLEVRRPALEAALERSLPSHPFLPILARAEAIADGEALDGETDLAWGMDAACLAGALPLLRGSARVAARRILRDCRTTVTVSPEEFASLPELAAQRVANESPRAQAELWTLLEAFGEVAVLAAASGPETEAAGMDVVRAVLARGGERLGVSTTEWSARLAAAEKAIEARATEEALEPPVAGEPGGVVFQLDDYRGPWGSASLPRVRGSVTPIVQLSFRAAPLKAAADAGSGMPSLPPEVWLVLHEDDDVVVRLTEVAPRADGGSHVLLSVVALVGSGLDLRADGAVRLLRGDHAVSSSVVRRTAREWEALVLEAGSVTLAVGERRIGFELDRGER